MGHWLVKTDPEAYSVNDFEREGQTRWDGVRNPLAQQFLRQMAPGDEVLLYHSGKDKAILAVASAVGEAYLDPNSDVGGAVCIDLKFLRRLKKPVTLAEIKGQPKLAEMKLVKMSRLSVMPVSRSHWEKLMDMAGE